jgi:DNA-directed RNA polymerase subunit beta'
VIAYWDALVADDVLHPESRELLAPAGTLLDEDMLEILMKP